MDIETRRKQWRKTFKKRDMPQPDGLIMDARYRADCGDWYVQLDDGDWYWYDRRDRVWKYLIYGPM